MNYRGIGLNGSFLLPQLTARKCLAPLEGKFDAKGAPMLCQRKEVVS